MQFRCTVNPSQFCALAVKQSRAARYCARFIILLCAIVLVMQANHGDSSAAPIYRQAVYQSAHFRIVYQTRGKHAPSAHDGNRNSIPDYVEWTAEAGEHALSTIIAQGFPRPPAYDDNDVFSLSGHYDIDIRRVDYEGYTESLSWLGDNPNTAATENDAWLARITIDNDFLALGYPAQKQYLQLFVAHELVHLAIAGTAWGSSGTLDCAHEWTAAWMESIVYPAIPNNGDYIQWYFNNPDIGILSGHMSNFDACYGLWLFPGYVAARHGTQAIAAFWRHAAIANISTFADVYEALDMTLSGSLATVFADFAVAVGGTRLAPQHTMPAQYTWPGNPQFPLLAIEATLDCGVDTSWSSSQDGDGHVSSLAAEYLEITNPSRCRLRVGSTDSGFFARVLMTRANQDQVEVQILAPGVWLAAGADVERMILIAGSRGAAPVSYTVATER